MIAWIALGVIAVLVLLFIFLPVVAWVQSLVEELRSHKPRGTASLAENILDLRLKRLT